ncbi:endonuclease domain-containing protein [Spirosoma areae]
MVIEIDGDIHDETDQREYDLNRNYMMTEFGIRVLRFTNKQIAHDMEAVLNTIQMALHESIYPPSGPIYPPSP